MSSTPSGFKGVLRPPEVLVEDVIAALQRFGPVEVESWRGEPKRWGFGCCQTLAENQTGPQVAPHEVEKVAK